MTPAVLQLANSVPQDRKTDLTNAQDINALKHASTRPEISGKNQLTYRNYLSARFVRLHHKHGVALGYQRLLVQVNFKTLLTSFNSNMKSARQIETCRRRLLEKARSNFKSNRLQKLIQREMRKETPNMNKVMKWQEKSARYVNRGLRYMNKFDAQNEDNREISFNLEKVCTHF